MDAKEAVRRAFQIFNDLFENEEVSNVGLEEVVYNEEENTWEITIGFSRPWDYPKPGPIPGMLSRAPLREYKVIRLDDETGQLDSIKIRAVSEAQSA